jgi:hypothetical protein
MRPDCPGNERKPSPLAPGSSRHNQKPEDCTHSYFGHNEFEEFAPGLKGSPPAVALGCPGHLVLTVLDPFNDFREEPILHCCSVRVVDDIT